MIIPLDQVPEADNRPLAHLSLTLDELGRADSVLRAAIDSFDDERAVVVRTAEGVHVWLIEFGGGRPGVTLLAPRDLSGKDEVIDEITGLLGVSPSAVAWRVTESET